MTEASEKFIAAVSRHMEHLLRTIRDPATCCEKHRVLPRAANDIEAIVNLTNVLESRFIEATNYAALSSALGIQSIEIEAAAIVAMLSLAAVGHAAMPDSKEATFDAFAVMARFDTSLRTEVAAIIAAVEKTQVLPRVHSMRGFNERVH